MNEISTADQRLTLGGIAGYSVWPVSGTAANDPVVWRTDLFERLSSDSVRVHGGQAGVTPARYINKLTLRELSTGLVFTRISTHVVHHIESEGKPMVYGPAEAVLFEHQQDRAKLHFALLRANAQAALLQGPVIVTGDFNVNYHAEVALAPGDRTPWFPLSMLGDILTPVMPKGGTQAGGNRAIDWTLIGGFELDGAQTVVPEGAMDPKNSDHRAVITPVASLVVA